MKKILFASLLSFGIAYTSQASPLSKEMTVVNYIEYCTKGTFSKIIGLYSTDMETYISTESIEQLWNSTVQSHGSFVQIEEIKNIKDGKYTRCIVKCEFKNQSCDFVFVFDENGYLKSCYTKKI